MSKKLFKLSLACLAIVSAGVSAMPEQQIGEQTLMASEVLQQISDDRNVIYINMRDIVDNNLTSTRYNLNFTEIKNNIISEGKKYLLDYTGIENKIEKDKARSIVKQAFGISFDSELVVISEYNGELSFSLFDSSDSPLIIGLDSAFDTPFDTLKSAEQRSEPLALTANNASEIPIKTYFVQVVKPIRSSDCNFPTSLLFPNSSYSRSICSSNAHISLNYKVSYFRSKSVSSGSSTTPDQKLVRVSLDNTAGAGILLNPTFGEATRTYTPVGNLFDGWAAVILSSAIAQSYSFTVSSNNTKAVLLQSVPRNNLNQDYSTTEVSGYTVGAEVKGTADVKGIGAEVGISASYSQQTRLTYNTADYQVIRTPNSAQSISYTWARQKYRTTDSLRNITTSPVWDFHYPLDTSRVSPLSHGGFVPNFDLVFGAEPEQTGNTRFTLSASVQIKPSYSRIYRHFYGIGAHHSYQSRDGAVKTVTSERTFDVDWDAAIFSGSFPVNLQLGASHNNSCLHVDTNKNITTSTCNDMSEQQSFVFDNNRYMSVDFPTYCLDSTLITQLKRCDSSRSQLWLWRKEGDIYTDLLTSTNINGDPVALTHDSSGVLSVSTVNESNRNQQMLTRFTTVF